MDDDRGPQYWRSISNMGGFVVVIGALIMMAALSQLRQIPAGSGMPAPPADTCTIENKPIPCSQIFGPSPADVAQEQAQQTADHAHALWMFGFLIFLGGLIPVGIGNSNLRRLRYQMMDYTYALMQSQQGQSQNRAEIQCPFCGQLNDPTNQYCGKCGKPLTTT